MESRRYVLGGYTAWTALLVAVYYWVGDLRIEAWALISLSGVTAILAGLAINRPARKGPWLLLAAALASFAAGQLSFLIAVKLGVVLPFPSFADVLYLAEYPLVAAGLLIFIHWRSPDGDRRSLIDATDAYGRPGSAVVDLPYPAPRVRPGALRAAEGRRDRLPARRRAAARLACETARAGDWTDQVRLAPGLRRRRLPGVRHGLWRHPAARVVPQRDHRRPRLGSVLLRVGRRGAASEP